MKKVGIITFYSSNNYGALLQAYSLSKKIRELSADVSFVFFEDAPKQESIPANIPPFIRKVKEESNIRNQNFDSFREQYLPGVRFYPDIDNDFDIFVVGSDQVWNRDIVGPDDRFFLSFASDSKKASYAANFGKVNGGGTDEETLSSLLYGFGDRISVRETSGADYLSQIMNHDITVSLDPTLLTKKEDWLPFLEESVDEPYLLFIMLQNDMKLIKKAEALATEKNLRLRLLTVSYFPPAGFEPWSRVSVPHYLNMINNASYVVTSSFHGLAFSLIFQKQFEVWPLQGNMADRNGRMTDLLKSLGLSHRIENGNSTIDYTEVSESIATMRTKSLEYLKKIILGE